MVPKDRNLDEMRSWQLKNHSGAFFISCRVGVVWVGDKRDEEGLAWSLQVLALARLCLSHLVVVQLVVLDDGVGDGVQDLSHGVQAAAVERGVRLGSLGSLCNGSVFMSIWFSYWSLENNCV